MSPPIDPNTLALQLRAVMLEITSQRFENLDSHLHFLLTRARGALAVNRIGLWLFERGGKRLRLKLGDHDHVLADTVETLDYDDFPHYFASLHTNFCLDAADARTDPRTQELCETYLLPSGVRSMMDVPIRALGKQIGVLCIEHASELRDWHLFEQSFASGIAAQISLALERDELAQANASIVRRVLFDPTTNLPNFLQLEDVLGQALGELFRGGPGIALLYADVEQFMLISNSLGQELAQALLIALSERLRAQSAGIRLLARATDTDFAFILRSDSPLHDARQFADALMDQMHEPLNALGRRVQCSLSIGYSTRCALDSELNSDAMLREAWTASRAARRGGEPRAFERSLLVRAALDVELEQELRKAIREGEFEPHLQPIFDLNERRIIGFEALIRWRQPERGLLTPIEFMGVAQRTGLMVPIGQQLLSITLKQFAELLKRLNDPNLVLYFNMSAPEFLRENLLQELTYELYLQHLQPSNLALEITESVVIEDMQRAQATISALHDLGINVHLDDLGTGYSSLNYLRVLPVDGIKIDYSFTHDIERNHRSAAMVKSLASLSDTLQQDAVAEGVEFEGQLAHLWACGVRLIQGYLLARPTPVAEITAERLAEVQAGANQLLDRLNLKAEA